MMLNNLCRLFLAGVAGVAFVQADTVAEFKKSRSTTVIESTVSAGTMEVKEIEDAGKATVVDITWESYEYAHFFEEYREASRFEQLLEHVDDEGYVEDEGEKVGPGSPQMTTTHDYDPKYKYVVFVEA